MDILWYYLVCINVATFLLYGEDKRRARKGSWRIRETTLLGTAAIGGSFGAWCGMRLFHHKTRHRIFSMGIPLLCVLQAAGLIGYYF